MDTQSSITKGLSEFNSSFLASSILMVRPVNFEYNAQTASSNYFMDKLTRNQHVHPKALREFDNFTNMLLKNNVDVLVFEAESTPPSPDSIFPNNWLSTHADGSIFLYPMEAPNRRLERRSDIIDALKSKFEVQNIVDLSFYEQQNQYLEGTGSMVLDRKNKIAYACLSSRTSETVLNDCCKLLGYKAICFNAYDSKENAIYHTNVMMSIGLDYVVICTESITEKNQAIQVLQHLEESGKDIIEISQEQVNHFAGNTIQLTSKSTNKLIVMSEQAYKSFTPKQLSRLEKFGECIYSPLHTIETVGGGSARCMIAEIYLKQKSEN